MLQHIPVLSDYDKGNGVCRYLQNNLCSIYANRPLICNVEKMYLAYFRNTITEKEFINMNIEACRKLSEVIDSQASKQKKIQKIGEYDIIKNMIPSIIRLFRPKDIPPIVPDCGWNHGESQEPYRQQRK
jgi:Fe-S-cluster containining protein